MNGKRLLIVEPYFGGSHAGFITGLQDHSAAHIRVLSLPARNWKMRMQLSAPWVFNCLQKMPPSQRHFDTVLCSTFMDVAVFRSLVTGLEGWNPAIRFCTYFHENQFAYPGQFADSDTRQFAAINYTTALASDRLAFNSHYNRQTFLDGCDHYLRKASEMGVQSTTREIAGKSRILHPGMEYLLIDQTQTAKDCHLPVIVWNHRWEHDKNPEEFFSALYELDNEGLDFRLILLGQSFGSMPVCFNEARTRLAEKILHAGYAESGQDYANLLKKGTIVISTARHEFFGVAVLEAVRAGCLPLLPDRLSYPELFPQQYLYPADGLVHSLRKLLQSQYRLDCSERIKMTEKYSWQSVRQDYAEWLFGA